MGYKCYFCEERERVGYWSNWCLECANLRRMLLLYSPKQCTDILKRTLTRDSKQIDYKIQQEVKTMVNSDIERMPTIPEESDESYEKPKTRGKRCKSTSSLSK